MRALLVLVMAVGSILMWLGVPVFWLWLASKLADSSQPSLGLYVLILVGIVISMILLGRFLGRINVVHQRLTGRLPERREQTMWLRSMRAEREVNRDSGGLGTVMVVSVSLAMLAAGIWFFFFAKGGGLPT
jgi:hypothetical protein